MAAKVAAIAGLLAASAAYGQAEAAEGREAGIDGGKKSIDTPASDRATALAEQVRARSGGGRCGCSPCWGPPAPPEMELWS